MKDKSKYSGDFKDTKPEQNPYHRIQTGMQKMNKRKKFSKQSVTLSSGNRSGSKEKGKGKKKIFRRPNYRK